MDDAEQNGGREQDQCNGEYSHQHQRRRDDPFEENRMFRNV